MVKMTSDLMKGKVAEQFVKQIRWCHADSFALREKVAWASQEETASLKDCLEELDKATENMNEVIYLSTA